MALCSSGLVSRPCSSGSSYSSGPPCSSGNPPPLCSSGLCARVVLCLSGKDLCSSGPPIDPPVCLCSSGCKGRMAAVFHLTRVVDLFVLEW